VCGKKDSQKCRGSITISPNRQIIKRVEHTCQSQDQILEKVQEYEETGGKFKINGYFYKFRHESWTKNKYYQCYKRCNAIKCRGSITISPNGQIIKRVEHTCQCQDQILEEVHEYEEIGRRFKINGYYYSFQREFKSKNQYYVCNKRKGQKCRGSITISPNRQIIKKVEHTCQFQEENLPDINAEILPGNEQNQERNSLPEIKVLFWIKYFAFTFN
jgi:c-di-GMP-related signal transduction protein